MSERMDLENSDDRLLEETYRHIVGLQDALESLDVDKEDDLRYALSIALVEARDEIQSRDELNQHDIVRQVRDE